MFKGKTVWKPVVTERKVHITGRCYDYPFQPSVPSEAASLECLVNGQREALEGLLWGFNPPQLLSLLVTKCLPSCVFGCMRRFLWWGEDGNKFQWFHRQVNCCHLPRWAWLEFACLRAMLSQNNAWVVPCLQFFPVYLVWVIPSNPSDQKMSFLVYKQITHISKWFTTGKTWTVLYARGGKRSLLVVPVPRRKVPVTKEA